MNLLSITVRRFLFSSLVLGGAWVQAANVDLTLYNTAALLDQDGATALEGAAGTGDLVQLVLVGANGVVDAPLTNGVPGGDDSLFAVANNPTHVGAGYGTPDTGLLVQGGMIYSDTLVGESVYARFWNGSSAAGSSYFGNSAIFTLPAADAFGQAEFDFVPTTSDPRRTNLVNPFSAVPIPTLSEWGMIGLAVLIGLAGARKLLGRQDPVPA